MCNAHTWLTKWVAHAHMTHVHTCVLRLISFYYVQTIYPVCIVHNLDDWLKSVCVWHWNPNPVVSRVDFLHFEECAAWDASLGSVRISFARGVPACAHATDLAVYLSFRHVRIDIEVILLPFTICIYVVCTLCGDFSKWLKLSSFGIVFIMVLSFSCGWGWCRRRRTECRACVDWSVSSRT